MLEPDYIEIDVPLIIRIADGTLDKALTAHAYIATGSPLVHVSAKVWRRVREGEADTDPTTAAWTIYPAVADPEKGPRPLQAVQTANPISDQWEGISAAPLMDLLLTHTPEASDTYNDHFLRVRWTPLGCSCEQWNEIRPSCTVQGPPRPYITIGTAFE